MSELAITVPISLAFVPVLPIDATTGQVIVQSFTLSQKCLTNGIGMFIDKVTVAISQVTAPGAGATIPDPVVQIVDIVADSPAAELGDMFLKIGDNTGILTATPQIPGTPPVSYPTNFHVEFDGTGQDKVRVG